jgi:SCP-2 sterol transfer family protein
MAVDIQKLFNEELPAILAKHSGAAKQIGGKLQIQIIGQSGGEWFLDLSDAGPRVIGGSPGGADATISITAQDFQHYYENPRVNGTSLLFAGRLKIIGNQMFGLRLSKVLGLFQPPDQ